MSIVDIKENEILRYDEQLLALLLKDNSSKKNIIWATDNYELLGEDYRFAAEIKEHLISGANGTIIRPRVSKSKEEQQLRVKDKAEVFTPSWICNKQNNLVDDVWFEDEDIFNKECGKSWETLTRPIAFPTKSGRSWQEYVEDLVLEITCGEAPYLVSRYDTISGESIAVDNRIGLLDRKLRVVSENVNDERDWLHWAKIAFKSTYGFEWQGDSLILARENLLYTFFDFYKYKFGKIPLKTDVRDIAEVIAWNIWQMDGLKGVIPKSCKDIKRQSTDMFGEVEETIEPCIGCKNRDMHKHNGIYCKIKDWKKDEILEFVSILKE